MKYIIESCKQPELVGGKAWNLLHLRKKFRVPGFVVVSTQAYKDYKKTGSFPKILVQELTDIFKHMYNEKFIAARSSGTAEDLKSASYAGMYATILNVSGIDAVLQAVQEVWASNDSPRVRAYRKQQNLQSGDMAVIIQQQLDPTVSGVMVTDDPLYKNTLIIECCEELGDKLVSGTITPARYRMRRKKTLEHSGEDLLTDGQLQELYKTGKRIEKVFQFPQDIEWAYDTGKLFILQSRPVTTSSKADKMGKVWCNANVRETIPDPISPMGFSFFEKIWFPSIMIETFGFPMTRKQYEQFPPVERVLGRLYWNLNNTVAYGKSIGPILQFAGAGDAIDPQLGRAMSAIDATAIPSLLSTSKMIAFSISAMIRLPYFLFKSFFRFRSARRTIDQVCAEIDRMVQHMQPVQDLNKGVMNVREWIQSIGGCISRRYFSGIVISVFYLAILSKILHWRMGEKGEAIARMTTYGLLDKTGEMVLAMHKLAEYARTTVSDLTIATLNRLYMRDKIFKSRYDSFIIEYGHRGPGEFDIASVTWCEDKNLVFGMLQNMPLYKEKRERSEIINQIVATLSSGARYFMKLFIPRITELTPIRETAKHYIFKIMRKAKEQLWLTEQALRKQGFLKKSRDIFFLTLEDLESIRDGILTKDETLRILCKRKAEWQQYVNIDVPDIVYEDGRQIFFTTKKQKGLAGTPLSYGRVRGRARIISTFARAKTLKKDDILVTHHTDPGWTPLFSIASGVIIEVGGLICHGAMVARELGLPAIVLPGATTTIPDGAEIEMDADLGTITII